MVQIGASQKFGLNLSIGIFQRSGVETNHSYLRFDLAPIEDVKSYVQSAELVLTVVGSERPTGAVVRVTGIAAMPVSGRKTPSNGRIRSRENAEFWRKYPLLAEVAINDKRDPRDAGQNLIRCSSPELAKLHRRTRRSDTRHAGCSPARATEMRSSVSSATTKRRDDAPKLVIEAPKEAPAGRQEKETLRRCPAGRFTRARSGGGFRPLSLDTRRRTVRTRRTSRSLRQTASCKRSL